MKVEIEVKTDLNKKLAQIQHKIKNLKPLFNQIGHTLIDIVEENFETETFLGEEWTPLAEATLKQKHKKGYKKILQNRGHLAESIDFEATNNKVIVGTNVEYAQIHQFGGKVGRNHTATIPARPFLPVVKKDNDYIFSAKIEQKLDIVLENYLKRL